MRTSLYQIMTDLLRAHHIICLVFLSVSNVNINAEVTTMLILIFDILM